MRQQTRLGTLALALGIGVGGSFGGARAATVINRGHLDIGLVYEGGAWDLHVHQEEPEPGAEYAPGDAVIQVGPSAALPGGVPAHAAATGFFGPAGSPLWILPKTQVEDLPFLGVGAEEMNAADWNGPLTLSLDRVDGPGNVFVWDVGSFGDLQPKMNSRDGVSSGDTLEVLAGSHAHYFWAFSAPGEYAVSFRASGVNAADGAVASEPATYHFQIIPEPGTVALFAVGALALATSRPRKGTHAS